MWYNSDCIIFNFLFMKPLKILIPLIIFVVIAGGGYYLYTNDYFAGTGRIQDEKALKDIQTEDEYVAALANVVSGYADAHLQLALIFNTDPERVDFETWQSWVSENLKKWEEIEKNAEAIIKYLDNQENSTSGLSFINTASAQSFMPDRIDFDPASVLPLEQDQPQFILPLVDYEGDEFESGAREVEFIDPSLNLYHQAMKTAEEAPKGETIKAVMERFGYKDARVAASLLESARNLDTRKWENVAEANDFLSKGATTIKNSSFTTVAVAGVVVTGGQLLTATTTVGKVWAGVNLAFGGADLVLQAGEKYNTIVDNRSGATYFKEGRENIKFINNVLGFVGLGSGLTGVNLITVSGYGESAVKYMDEINRTEEDTTIIAEKQLFMTDFGYGNQEVSLSYKGNFTNPYENNPELLMASLEALFPKGAVVKIDDVYIQVGTHPSQPNQIVAVPQEQDIKDSSFSGGYVLTDPTTGINTTGNLSFQIASGGEISGFSELTIDGTVTMRGLTTTVSGSGSAQITGSYDNVKNEIYMGGNYNLTSVSTTSGQSVQMSDSGTLVFKGTMSEFNVFSGDLTLQSGRGTTLTTNWSANKKGN
jgi:hypothetical protein